jgi:hypothetical protein
MVMDSTARNRARRELVLAWWKSPLATALFVCRIREEKGSESEQVRRNREWRVCLWLCPNVKLQLIPERTCQYRNGQKGSGICPPPWGLSNWKVHGWCLSLLLTLLGTKSKAWSSWVTTTGMGCEVSVMDEASYLQGHPSYTRTTVFFFFPHLTDT